MQLVIFIVQQMMYFSIPLLIVALAAMFSERSGVINIGLEGIMVMGAFAGTLYLHFAHEAETFNPQLGLCIAILIAMAAGLAFSCFHALASVNMFADQTISGTAINLFATAFVIFTARSVIGIQQVLFSHAGYKISRLGFLADIPIIGPMFFQNVYITTIIGIVVLILSIYVLYSTRFGLRLRSAGEFPQATDAAGVSVAKIRWAGVLISGALGGLGGFAYILPNSTSFDGTVAGYGFLAIAVLIFGQWKPKYIALAAFFFGILKAISASYTGIPFLLQLGIPQMFYQILPYVVTIFVLFLTSERSAAPAAEGQPFDKGQR